MTVRTFELAGTAARAIGEAPTLAQASAVLPSGAYTSLRTYGGSRVLRLEEHVRRLEHSVALQGQPGVLDSAAVRGAIAAALATAGHPESRLRLTFAPPRLFASVEPFEPLPEALYLEGVACVTLGVRRENPHAKDTRFIATAHGAYGSLPDGVHEGLLVAADGSLLEGLSSNFFALRGGELHTEEERVLAGVTRSLVLEVAERLLPVRRTAIRKHELALVDEAFITSVSREVLPVVRVDGRPLGDGRVGPKTRAILDAFAALVEREREPL